MLFVVLGGFGGHDGANASAMVGQRRLELQFWCGDESSPGSSHEYIIVVLKLPWFFLPGSP